MSQLNFKNGNIESGKNRSIIDICSEILHLFKEKETAFFSLESRINVDFSAQLRFSFVPFPSFSMTKK